MVAGDTDVVGGRHDRNHGAGSLVLGVVEDLAGADHRGGDVDGVTLHNGRCAGVSGDTGGDCLIGIGNEVAAGNVDAKTLVSSDQSGKC